MENVDDDPFEIDHQDLEDSRLEDQADDANCVGIALPAPDTALSIDLTAAASQSSREGVRLA